MIDYDIGERVIININPIRIETAPHKRYQGKVGVITGKRGKAYIVELMLGSKVKKIITTKEHIVKYQVAQ
jgi:Ribosomal protein L21E